MDQFPRLLAALLARSPVLTALASPIYHPRPKLRTFRAPIAANRSGGRLVACRNPQRRRKSKEAAAIVARLVNFCWYFFKLGLALAVVGAVAMALYMYVRMDDEIRRHVHAFLAEQYPQLSVEVGGARLVEGKGIAVYDLSLALPGAGRSESPLLAIDELLLVCNVELATLVRGQPPVHRVEVKHPQLSLSRNASGDWNLGALLRLKPCTGPIPQVIVRGGELTIADDSARDRAPLAFRDLSFTIVPTAGNEPPQLGADSAPVAPPSAGEAGALAATPWPSVKIEGAAAGPHLKQLNFQATVDGPARQVSASCELHQLQVSEPLLAWVRPYIGSSFETAKITGCLDGTVTASWTGLAETPPAFTANLALSDGRLEDPRLERPLTDVAGAIAADARQLKVEGLRGKWGASSVALSLNRNGWHAAAPIALSACADDVTLDEDLYRTLANLGAPHAHPRIPVASLMCEEWDKFRPTGVVNATLQATFDQGRWKPTATLTGRRLAFESDKFPYRLSDGDGKLTFTPADGPKAAQIDIDLFAVGGGQRLHIVGQVFDPKPAAAGWAQISGQGLEIEERMINALREEPRRVVASLRPTGKFNLAYWRIERRQPGAEPKTSLRLDLTDVRINYELFPYPLREIRGVITAEDDNWTFTELISGGRRTIKGEGHLRPGPNGDGLKLTIAGWNVPLDDNLFFALQEPAQQTWKRLRPNGAINLTAEVRHRPGQGPPNIAVAIQPLDNFSLRPDFFAYLMDDVTGEVTYNDGAIALYNMKAHHDGVSMGVKQGQGYFSPENGWQMQLTGVWADRISARPDLLAALPPKLGRIIDQLRPNGSFNLHGSELAFRQPPSPIAPLETTWDLQLACHQTDLHCGLDLDHITGSVRLTGRSDGQRSVSAGELNLETATYQGVQFTNIRGPLWIDESHCRLGKHATDQMGQPTRRITSNVYEGAMASDGWVSFGALPQYAAEANLTGADVNRFLVERFGGQQNLRGKVDAEVMISGEGPSLARLGGEGKIHLRDANIGELPLLASLLKMLRLSSPDKTAFTNSNIAFQIKGQNIYLNQIDFLGEIVDLYGYGETGFDQHLKLIFRPDWGPRQYHIPIVKQLVGQASQSMMQLYVDGTVNAPHVTTEAFPDINQILQQIGAGLEGPGGTPGRQANRDLLNPSR